MSDASLPAAFERQVVEHMNADHADALLLYVTVLADRPKARSVQLLAIDLEAMTIATDLPGPDSEIRVPLKPRPTDAAQVRAALVAMAKQARRLTARDG